MSSDDVPAHVDDVNPLNSWIVGVHIGPDDQAEMEGHAERTSLELTGVGAKMPPSHSYNRRCVTCQHCLDGQTLQLQAGLRHCVLVDRMLNIPATCCRISNNCTYCHTNIEVADQTCHLIQSPTPRRLAGWPQSHVYVSAWKSPRGKRGSKSEAHCLPLSESEGKRGGYVIPKYALCNGSKDES